ncbi:MAG: AmmeMemoRadiSam system protein B [Candidatus Rokuibacteriota bacterium]
MSDTPRLRNVEAFPVEHEGRSFVALRDPAGYTAAVLMLPAPVVEIVALFDGRHTITDIQAELMRRHGETVSPGDLQRLVDSLDEHGFMDGERFTALRERTDGEFLAASSRPASHAGGAYPDEPDDLRAAMDGFFTHADGPGRIDGVGASAPPVRGLIAPHIDFHRGGPAYAWGYRPLGERCDADLFVILGTCHAGMRDPFALTRKDYETPFGSAATDRDFVEALARRAGQDCFGSESAHRTEHSIEFQAVFLRYLFTGRRDFTVVPVLAGFAHEALAQGRAPEADPRVPRFLDALVETIAASRRRVAVVAGADLAHVGPRFGDPEPVSDAELARIEGEDRAMLQAVEAGDAAGFFRAVAADGDRRRICGLSPIYSMLRVLGPRPGDLRHYGYWPDPQGVVSYASVVF